MLEISHAAASRAIIAHVEARTIVQGKWHGRDNDGREIACLLGSIHPSVTSAAECNGALMPMWLAELTPILFDALPAERIYSVARRFGELVGRWHALSEAQWQSLLTRFLVRKAVIESGNKADAAHAAYAAARAARAADAADAAAYGKLLDFVLDQIERELVA